MRQVNLVPMTREFITQSLGGTTSEEEMTYYLNSIKRAMVRMQWKNYLVGKLDELTKKKELEEQVRIKNTKLATTPTPEMLKKMNQRNKIWPRRPEDACTGEGTETIQLELVKNQVLKTTFMPPRDLAPAEEVDQWTQ